LEVSSADITRPGKYSWISAGVINPVIVGDIHMVLSSGPYTILPNQTRVVGFALVAGNSLSRIRSHADAAKAKWDNLKSVLDVGDPRPALPARYSLSQNYPNPFNPTTSIGFSIPVSGMVRLRIFDVLGSEVATLVNEHMQSGTYSRSWNAGNVASGVYFYRLEVFDESASSAARFTDVKKLILLK
jgi:hypothetical protein